MKMKLQYLPAALLLIGSLSACEDRFAEEPVSKDKDTFTLKLKTNYSLDVDIKAKSWASGKDLYCYSWPIGKDSSSRIISEGFPKVQEKISNGYYQYELPCNNQTLFFSNINYEDTLNKNLPKLSYERSYTGNWNETASMTFTMPEKGYSEKGIIWGNIPSISENNSHYFVNDSIGLQRPDTKMMIYLRLTNDSAQVISNPEAYITRIWLKTRNNPFSNKYITQFYYSDKGNSYSYINEFYDDNFSLQYEIPVSEMPKYEYKGELLPVIFGPYYIFLRSQPYFEFTFQLNDGRGKQNDFYANYDPSAKESHLVLDISLSNLLQ